MKVGKVFFYKPSHDITSTKKHVVNKHNIVLDQYKKKKKKNFWKKKKKKKKKKHMKLEKVNKKGKKEDCGSKYNYYVFL